MSTGTIILWYIIIIDSDKIDFTRDIVAYMVVLAVIVIVLYDGKVKASCLLV